MNKTGAWLVRYALEQIGITNTFGIPGVHNTEIYDELNNSETIDPILVTHEACAAFMADAVSRTTETTGTLLIVPAAGATHAASGIGEASLDGIPMLIISGGVRSDSAFQFQLHDMDQHRLLEPITKARFKVTSHKMIVPTLFNAHDIAVSGEPGPVFVEIPVNIQIDTGKTGPLPEYTNPRPTLSFDGSAVDKAVKALAAAEHPGLFLGWGAVHASDISIRIAEHLGAPVATTLQGLSAFPGNHPLHTGLGIGSYAVPASEKAFKDCDCLLAVGTRFSEIATGSFSFKPPETLIHIDINSGVFNANYPSAITLQGDSALTMDALFHKLCKIRPAPAAATSLKKRIAKAKKDYMAEWLRHDSKGRVNPGVFFKALRSVLDDDGILVCDDGNHTFLTAELMPVNRIGGFISPTDFNCMGYAVPAAIAAGLTHPGTQVAAIIGDGAFLMTGLEMVSAKRYHQGVIFIVFNDGELSQIAQMQTMPYNRKTCTVLSDFKLKGIADATGASYIRIDKNETVENRLAEAFSIASEKIPVLVDVNIDYSKPTRFTKGILGSNIWRLKPDTAVRMGVRTAVRKFTG